MTSSKRMTFSQARRQDLAAEGAKNQEEGSKSRRGARIFKIQYWMYAAIGGQMWNGGHPFQMGGPGTTIPPLATALPSHLITTSVTA